MTIECTKYKSCIKGNLLGFADLWIPKWGVEITGCSHCCKGTQEWINLPSREYTKPDTNEKAYAPIVKFREKAHATAFGAAALKVVQAKMAEMATTPQQGQADQYSSQEVPF